MSLTADPFIESVRAERDVEVPTFRPEVDTLGAFVIEDAEGPYDAQHVRSGRWSCFCQDGRHRDDRDRQPFEASGGWLPKGAHPITVHTYAVVVEEKTA